jgi:BirA family biotin operon repressor/biotin-[acetyl-CoA-carboxylase] ligase
MFSHNDICRLARRQAESSSCAGVERILKYGTPVGSCIEHHFQLDRCMDRLRMLLGENDKNNGSLPTGTVIRADTLKNSAGRFERSWHAPPGGLYLALAWADTLLPDFNRLLPFAIGIACHEVIDNLLVVARLKWVNDVLVRGKKIAGVLCETVITGSGERYHLIGIGININNREFPAELGSIATSVARETGQEYDLNDACLNLLARLQWNIGLLYYGEELFLAADENQRLTMDNPVLKHWLSLSDTIGREVLYGYDVQLQPLYRGRVLDIDKAGSLIMELEDGSRIVESSGEVVYL